jgi:pyridoxal phosphate enzyme (YggS family)
MGLDAVAFDVISRNLAQVRQRIADAAERAGRRANEVRLIAVTKYVGQPEIEALVAAGCSDLGESRPQELWRKAAELDQHLNCRTSHPPSEISHLKSEIGTTTTIPRWHLVGHLQRNKVRRALPLVEWIHSADSLRLLEEIDEQARTLSISRPRVLLEVNVSGDATKTGFRSDELEPLIPRLERLHSVEFGGLMCMAAREGDLDVARRNFSDLRELRDRLARVAPPRWAFAHLSMGMSSDFEVAIEEGATMVRVGSALFE